MHTLYCPEGAATNQPRATPWVGVVMRTASPERAKHGSACDALSGLMESRRFSLPGRCPGLICYRPFGAPEANIISPTPFVTLTDVPPIHAGLLLGKFLVVSLLATLLLGPSCQTLLAQKPSEPKPAAAAIPDAKQSGGEPDGIVQVANLVYAGTHSSHCFADHFLVQAEKDSSISTSRRFHAVKLAGDDLYEYPLVIMTGEGTFDLSEAERQSLRKYVERGGFLIASASCSSTDWDRSFRQEMARVFPNLSLRPIPMEHAMFHTVYDIQTLGGHHGDVRPLEGISIGGRLGVVYSQDGLNDTQHTQGCCCCGGNEITNAILINVNLLAYALLY
jgi:hypothetical protein